MCCVWEGAPPRRADPRARRIWGPAKKCGLYPYGTEWEITLPGLCVRKASLTAVWRMDWRRQGPEARKPVTTIAKSRGEIVRV